MTGSMPRRQFAKAWGAVVLGSAFAPFACHTPVRREDVLASVVRDVLVPEMADLGRADRDLCAATKRFSEQPNAEELGRTRDAWKRAAISWKKVTVFRAGPLLETEALARAAYFPVRRAAVDMLIEAERPIDASSVADLGSDVKGVYALEYLLFDQEGADPALAFLTGESGKRRRELASAYAEDVRALGDRAAKALGPDGRDYATAFSSGGLGSVSLLISRMVEAVEKLVTGKLSLVLWLESLKKLKRSDIEGGPSRTSHQLTGSVVDGVARLYSGGDRGALSSLVRQTAPRIHERLQSVFRAADSSVKALGAPLEDVVTSNRPRVEAVRTALKALEVSLKADLASALGATLDFASADAD